MAHWTGKYVLNEIKNLKREKHELTVLDIKSNDFSEMEIMLKDETGNMYYCFASKERVFNNNFLNELLKVGIGGKVNASFKILKKYIDSYKKEITEFYEPRILKNN
jgi:hypothetical protein